MASEVDFAQVWFAVGQPLSVSKHFFRFETDHPANRIVGVRSHICDGSGGGELGIVSPGQRHVRRAEVVPAE